MAAQKARFLCQSCSIKVDNDMVLYQYTFNATLDQGLVENNIWLITPNGNLSINGVKNVFDVGTIYEFTIRKLSEV